MAGIALIGYTFCVIAVVALAWLITRRRSQRAAPLATPIQSLLNAARRRAVIAVLFSGLVIVVLFTAGFSLNSLVGLPVALAPAFGGAAGLLLYSATPPRVLTVRSDAARAASLTPRTPLSFIPPLGASLLAAGMIVQVAFLIFTGVTSSPDELGRYRVIEFHTSDSSSASSPYAGWFYGVPLLVATGVLVAATLLALLRVSSTPALPQREFTDLDAGWRRATNRIIIAISGAAILLQFGGVAVQSGMAMRNAHFDGIPTGWDTLGKIFIGGGLVMMIGSIACLTLAALWAFSLSEFALRGRSPVAPRRDERARDGVSR